MFLFGVERKAAPSQAQHRGESQTSRDTRFWLNQPSRLCVISFPVNIGGHQGTLQIPLQVSYTQRRWPMLEREAVLEG